MRAGSDLYTSVSRLRATDAVVTRIEELILQSRLRAGDPLPAERELAARLAVSRTVLREALGILSQKGLIRVVPGRGAFVAEPGTQVVSDSLTLLLRLHRVSLDELTDARLLIEPALAALACERATAADLERIERALGAMLAVQDRPEEHVQADLAFHAAIATAAHHTVFEAIVAAVGDSMQRSMELGTRLPRAIADSDAQHQRIAAALQARDRERAAEAMREHLRYVQRYVRQLVAAGEEVSPPERAE